MMYRYVDQVEGDVIQRIERQRTVLRWGGVMVKEARMGRPRFKVVTQSAKVV